MTKKFNDLASQVKLTWDADTQAVYDAATTTFQAESTTHADQNPKT